MLHQTTAQPLPTKAHAAPTASDTAAATALLYRYLTATTLLGTLHGLHELADEAAQAVEVSLDDTRQFRLAQALACTLGKDPESAQPVLEEHLQDHPDDEQAQVILATLLMRLDQPGWQPLLERVLATSVDPGTRHVAQQLMKATEIQAVAQAA